MRLYIGMFKDYQGFLGKKGERILQVKDTVDALSCEIMASLGVIEIEGTSHGDILLQAKALAVENDCTRIDFLELDNLIRVDNGKRKKS